MRTTLDLPDELFKKVKLKAVNEGVPLKTIITRAIEREMGQRETTTLAERHARAKKLFAAMDGLKLTKPVGRIKREEIYDRAVFRR